MASFRHVGTLLLLTVLFTSCSKDQKYVEWLGDGSWSQTSTTINGEEQDTGGILVLTQIYNKCNVKNADCTGLQDFSLDLGLGGVVAGGSTFLFRIHEKGTQITFTTLTLTVNDETRDCTSDCISTWDILEMNKDRHVIRMVDDNGDTWIKVFEKI